MISSNTNRLPTPFIILSAVIAGALFRHRRLLRPPAMYRTIQRSSGDRRDFLRSATQRQCVARRSGQLNDGRSGGIDGRAVGTCAAIVRTGERFEVAGLRASPRWKNSGENSQRPWPISLSRSNPNGRASGSHGQSRGSGEDQGVDRRGDE